jgi:rhodanese-related sulfurtransferase
LPRWLRLWGLKKLNRTFVQANPRLIRFLAGFALLLAIAAAFVGSPHRQSRVTIDTRELARIVENEEDHIDAVQLAEWIMEKKSDLIVVDLRTQSAFDSSCIPTAINTSLRQLDSALQKNQTIVLYSEGGVHSAQAWFLLKALGYPRVFSLKGGMREWESEVLFPTLDDGIFTKEERQHRTELSKFFGGEVRRKQSGVPQATPSRKPMKPGAPKQKPEKQPQREPFREVC